MVQAQLTALLYWPGGEFMYLVFTTSTGEAITVVTKPAPNADTKWHGRLSEERVGEKITIRSLFSAVRHRKTCQWILQSSEWGNISSRDKC